MKRPSDVELVKLLRMLAYERADPHAPHLPWVMVLETADALEASAEPSPNDACGVEGCERPRRTGYFYCAAHEDWTNDLAGVEVH